MKVLVTGGAGYIGSVMAETLLKHEHDVVAIDNLSHGHLSAVPSAARFFNVDICNRKALDDIFTNCKIDAVVHMAAETVIEYSMTEPNKFFAVNVIGGWNLLESMHEHDVTRMIFSSTAAVYGEPTEIPICEGHPLSPINAYGESKLIFERMLSWYAKAYKLQYVTFRYFNAAGATEMRGENHQPETHLIPTVLNSALNGNSRVSVFGGKYHTKDGSCVRDYVHVLDIAQAHLLALESLGILNGKIYNLGSENGYSVLEIIEAVKKVTGAKIPIHKAPARPGDPAVLIASSQQALLDLRWRPAHSDINTIIESAWNFLVKQRNTSTI